MERWGAHRWQALAPLLLCVSAVASVAVSTFTDPIDLHIYVLGGAALVIAATNSPLTYTAAVVRCASTEAR